MTQRDEDGNLEDQIWSTTALVDVKELVLKLAGSPEENQTTLQQTVGSVPAIASKLDQFQEDPLLLDPLLKELLPALVNKYLTLISNGSFQETNTNVRVLSDAIAKTLYQFCKVRGAKVVTRFLNNEPRWVSPMLMAYQALNALKAAEDADSDLILRAEAEPSGSWQERYLCLLWLGHLMYTPFDLETLSTELGTAPPTNSMLSDLKLANELPQVAKQTFEFAMHSLQAPDRRQSASAALLTRLAVRPDMRRLGLLDGLMSWAKNAIRLQDLDPEAPVHRYVGILAFISGTLSAADVNDSGKFMREVFDSIATIFGEGVENYQSLTTSAIGKKMAIKIQRSIIMKIWNAESETAPDPMSMLEDTIDFLLTALADRDTQVRRAASKALSIIAGKIDAEMAEEIVEAVLGSLNENVLSERGSKSLQAVNALRWHGLTLTLAQMLFRRLPSPAQLPDILTALFRALSFEQRSAAGSSLGGNVRDAANFGIWSLARRYTTHELQQVGLVNLTQFGPRHVGYDLSSVLPLAASHLIVSACTDPVGNVRRGSSAALQELIGRHPNTIPQGVPLVQVVDYHAVGLRKRALIQVAREAASMAPIYLNYLIDAVLGWRGCDSIDKSSRELAADSLGHLIKLLPDVEASRLLRLVKDDLQHLKTAGQDVERRHGLLCALAACIEGHTSDAGEMMTGSIKSVLLLMDQRPFALTVEDFRSISAKPEVTAAGALKLMQSLLRACIALSTSGDRVLSDAGREVALQSLTLALAHVSESDYPLASAMVSTVGDFCAAKDLRALVRLWLERLHDSRRLFRGPALMLAAGTIWHHLGDDAETKQSILDELIRSAGVPFEIETRVLALRSLGYIVNDLHLHQHISQSQQTAVFTTLWQSLNDYTTNERGDVGSLLRSEALCTLRSMPRRWSAAQLEVADECLWSTCRLAVERLHKLRAEAFACLQACGRLVSPAKGDTMHDAVSIANVSTFDYFAELAALMASSPASLHPHGHPDRLRLVKALLEGFSSSAGVGNESVLDNARHALVLVLDNLLASAETCISLLDVGNVLIDLIRENLSVERVLVPVLELTAFLLDAHVLTELWAQPSGFKWRTLLSYVQKSHFKSSSIPKMLIVIGIYRSLADVPQIKTDVVTKLVGMLSHPFPRIREAVAESLWVITRDPAIREMELLKTPMPKAIIDTTKERYIKLLA